MCMECVWGQGLKEGSGEVEGRKEKENGGLEPKLKTPPGSPFLTAEVCNQTFGRVSFPFVFQHFLPQVHSMIIFPFIFGHFIFYVPPN